jgi:hypothetical protein
LTVMVTGRRVNRSGDHPYCRWRPAPLLGSGIGITGVGIQAPDAEVLRPHALGEEQRWRVLGWSCGGDIYNS